jgi:hypothetical protein
MHARSRKRQTTGSTGGLNGSAQHFLELGGCGGSCCVVEIDASGDRCDLGAAADGAGCEAGTVAASDGFTGDCHDWRHLRLRH